MEKLLAIIEGIKKNEFVLPDFQREFVWNFKQQKDLIASVISDVPASSSLLVKENNFDSPKFRCIKVGRRNSKNQIDHKTPFHYILDGQQRFTTLYYAFSNVFNADKNSNEEIFKDLDSKLRVRWFLNFKTQSGYLFNFDTLIYEERVFDQYLPNDIIDYIEEEKVKIDETRQNFDEYLGFLKAESLSKLKIPLQLFLLDDAQSYKIKKWLKEIQKKRISDLKNKSENKDCIIKLFKHFKKDKPNKIAEDLYKDKDYAIKIFDNCINDDLVCDWYDKVYSYLKSKISNYEIKPIVLEDMFKAISTFEYINTRGTDLSTFDLLCAKAGVEFDLRKGVVEECNKPFKFFDYDFEEDKNFSLIDNFNLIDSNDSVQKQYAEYLAQVFNLLHYKKKNFTPNQEEFSTKLQKSNYSLDNLDSEFLANNYKEAVKIINFSSAILQVFCAHKDQKKIQNKLILLPIFTFFVYKVGEITSGEIKKIISFFWIKLFSGEYDSHQSESAKRHCKEIYEWLILGEESIKENLKVQLNNRVLQVDEFADRELLTTQKCNKSIEENIFMFLRSSSKNFYDWDNNSSIIRATDDVQIHHIIPLFSGITKMKELTKELRKNPENQLNATMNRTPISKETNSEIGAKSPNQYQSEVNATQLSYHYVTEDWFKQNPDLNKLFKARFDALKVRIITKLDEFLG